MAVTIESGRIFGTRLGAPLHWVGARCPQVRALALAPPLIGGGPAHHLRIFRTLIRRGLQLVSFSYAGHGSAPGRFSLQSTLNAAMDMTEFAIGRAGHHGIPLYGVGLCYGALPMLHGAGTPQEPFERIALVNPVTALRLSALLRSAFDHFSRGTRFRTLLKSPGLLMRRYLDRLFPEVETSRYGFGCLPAQNARLWAICREITGFHPLAATYLQRTRLLCMVSSNDPVLQAAGFKSPHHVRRAVHMLGAGVECVTLPDCHYIRHSENRRLALERIAAFFNLN